MPGRCPVQAYSIGGKVEELCLWEPTEYKAFIEYPGAIRQQANGQRRLTPLTSPTGLPGGLTSASLPHGDPPASYKLTLFGHTTYCIRTYIC